VELSVLKLKCDEPLSMSAFKLNLRRYIQGGGIDPNTGLMITAEALAVRPRRKPPPTSSAPRPLASSPPVYIVPRCASPRLPPSSPLPSSIRKCRRRACHLTSPPFQKVSWLYLQRVANHGRGVVRVDGSCGRRLCRRCRWRRRPSRRGCWGRGHPSPPPACFSRICLSPR